MTARSNEIKVRTVHHSKGAGIELTFPDGSYYFSDKGKFDNTNIPKKENFDLLKKQCPRLIRDIK